MTPDLETLIDRIVDGDLPPAALREALARVDAAPDGWRRCTLAFLEARCLDDAFRRPADHAPEILTMPAAPAAAPRGRTYLHRGLAAAVALLCFGAGWLAGGRPGPAPPPQPNIAAPIQVAATDAAPTPNVATHASQADRPTRSEPRPAALAVPTWVLNQPPPVSADAQAALAARGYQLDQRRRIVTGRLADGRRVVVPVDSVGVRYVGGHTL